MDGKLIGITSAVNQEIGYAINITSIKSWINTNDDNDRIASSLQERMNNLITEQYSLKSKNNYSNVLPHIELIKPADWEFDHDNENYIGVSNTTNNEGGTLNLYWLPTDNYTEPILDVTIEAVEMMMNCFGVGKATVAGIEGRKIICPYDSEELVQYLVPSKNYIITVTYYYGKDDVDKEKIDGILDSLVISDSNNNFVIEQNYEHNTPYFKINLPNGYSLKALNHPGWPIGGQRIEVPEIGFNFYIRELTDSMQEMDNETYFDFIKDTETVKSNTEDTFGLKGQRYYLSTDYRINNELSNEILAKYRFEDEDDGDKVKKYAAGYRVRDGQWVIIIEYTYLGDDEVYFEELLTHFQQYALTNLTLGREIMVTDEPASEEVSTQEEEGQTQDTAPAVTQPDKDIRNVGKGLIGRILLQVEANGEAWYLCPDTNKAHFLGRPEDAFNVMRNLGLGISEKDYLSFNGYAPSFLKGKILLRVEANGEAYYVNPKDRKMHYLGRPADAFSVMRSLGLGISNNDFSNL